MSHCSLHLPLTRCTFKSNFLVQSSKLSSLCTFYWHGIVYLAYSHLIEMLHHLTLHQFTHKSIYKNMHFKGTTWNNMKVMQLEIFWTNVLNYFLSFTSMHPSCSTQDKHSFHVSLIFIILLIFFTYILGFPKSIWYSHHPPKTSNPMHVLHSKFKIWQMRLGQIFPCILKPKIMTFPCEFVVVHTNNTISSFSLSTSLYMHPCPC
jgi:hypothetical protein